MIVSRVYNWLQNNLPVETHCLLCRGKTAWKTPICEQCFDVFPAPIHPCHYCGLEVQDEALSLCSACMITSPEYDLCLAAYLYEYPIRQVVQAIKYQKRLEMIRPMMKQLTHSLQDYYLDTPWPEVMIPIPLHNRRLRQRGYDQTLLMAKELRRQLPDTAPTRVDAQLLIRTKATAAQQGLDAKARRKNIRRAFTINSKATYRHIALIDDVVTTGETVSEAARMFKKSGVEKVDVWTLARTPEPDK